MKKVSIIVVTWNSEAYIWDCLTSLLNQTYRDFEIIVVDNNSHDHSVDIIKQFPVTLIVLKKNYGFSIGNNEGVKRSTSPYIVLLNPDTKVDRDWLLFLTQTIEEDRTIGIVTSKIYLGESRYLDSAGSQYNNILNAWSRGVFEEDKGQFDKEEEVPMATACSMILRREILDNTYLFDPDFFMYIEELDFSLRVHDLGYTIIYQPHSVAHHKKSQSVLRIGRNEIFFKQYHGNINRAKMLGKYMSGKDLFLNFHLILISFVYWDWYFFIHLKWWMLCKMIILELYYFIKGFMVRTSAPQKDLWKKWCKNMNLRDLIHFKKELELKQRMYEQKQ